MTKVNGSNKQTRGSIRAKANMPAKAGKRALPPSKGKHETSHADRRTAIWTADRLGVSNRRLKLRRVEAGSGYAMPQRSDDRMDDLRVYY